jgi:hypothetical protein
VLFADGVAHIELTQICRAVARDVKIAFSLQDGRQLCRDRPFDSMLFKGSAEDIVHAGSLRDEAGWMAQMPIIGICTGAVSLVLARAAGISILFPWNAPRGAIKGALMGALVRDGRNDTWWID